MSFEFNAPTRIIFGKGAARQIAPEAKRLGRHALAVTGASPDRAAAIMEDLRKAGVETTLFSFPKEPSVQAVQEGIRAARDQGCDLVLGVGGGSPIDGAKAIAALITNTGDMTQYLEVIGDGRPIEKSPAPVIAVPTTAGAGAEVTRNAVIKVDNHRVKVSMRSPLMVPDIAVVDPLLTVSMPQATTAACGLDALTQVLEPFVSCHASPLTDALCRDGMRLAARSLKRAYDNGDDLAAREDMCIASLFGGLALANAKLGAVHGFAGPLGGMYDAPHGVLCGRLLPPVTTTNIAALKQRSKDAASLAKYDEVARILTGQLNATAEDAARWLSDIGDALALPPLSTFGIRAQDVDDIVEKSKHASSMKGNPIALTDGELKEIIETVL